MSSLDLPLGEPLSPELALVCPELAEKARRLLPEPRSFAPAATSHRLARPSARQVLALGVASILMTVTPLVLMLLLLNPHPPHHAPRAAQASRPAQVWP